jgi:2-hydroxychromene-2-carboxylate isomerase
MVTPMEKPRVEHHFDFGSPNCYFAHRVIGAIEQRTGATFTYVPILLGGVFKATNNQAPLIAFKDIANKLAYDRLEIKRFVARHRLAKFRINPHFPVNTLQVMRGITALEGDPSFMATIEAIFCLMWQDGRKMDDAEVIVRSLQEREFPRARGRTGGQGQAHGQYRAFRRTRDIWRTDLLRRR